MIIAHGICVLHELITIISFLVLNPLKRKAETVSIGATMSLGSFGPHHLIYLFSYVFIDNCLEI